MTIPPDSLDEIVDVARGFLADRSVLSLDTEDLARSFARALVQVAGCCVVGTPCRWHAGAVHGQEAEELRAGVEQILRNTADVHDDDEEMRRSLIFLLDRVDARDSLAFREATDGATDKNSADHAIWDAELAVRAEAAQQAMAAQGGDFYQVVADAFGLSREEAERRFRGTNSVTAA